MSNAMIILVIIYSVYFRENYELYDELYGKIFSTFDWSQNSNNWHNDNVKIQYKSFNGQWLRTLIRNSS